MRAEGQYIRPNQLITAEEQRMTLLTAFASSPDNDKVWHEAEELVRRDGNSMLAPYSFDELEAIDAEELISFAERVRGTEPARRYDLMVESAYPGSDSWFDVLRSFSSLQVERAKLSVLGELVEIQGRPFRNALDIGTGTGNSLATLEAVAIDVTGIDRHQGLLDIAATKKRHDTRLVHGTVDHLPYADNSLELAASSGLYVSLDASHEQRLYEELARVLAPGGVYIEGANYPTENGYMGYEIAHLEENSKAMLADMIVDITSGRVSEDQHMSRDMRQELFARINLREVDDLVADAFAGDGTVTYIRLITKPEGATNDMTLAGL